MSSPFLQQNIHVPFQKEDYSAWRLAFHQNCIPVNTGLFWHSVAEPSKGAQRQPPNKRGTFVLGQWPNRNFVRLWLVKTTINGTIGTRSDAGTWYSFLFKSVKLSPFYAKSWQEIYCIKTKNTNEKKKQKYKHLKTN